MIGLIDCNNFFASCERVFDPSLNNRPVVVLSNNDGCVIARSQESKKMGIKMGVPAYQIQDLIDTKQVIAFSSNYTLYGDMSSRVMSILADSVPSIEVYSIDEAFLDFSGIEDVATFGQQVVRKTYKGTGIPVSLGVAPTKVLAKLANHFAKKYPAYNRVCLIDTDEKRIKALKITPVGDIWGIGRRSKKLLEYHSVTTAYDLTQKSRSWVRSKLTVVGERIWLELQGIPCIEAETVSEKQQICTSRSFGNTVADFDNLRESVANFASLSAHKLRKQNCLAQGIIVFAYTNRFRDDQEQYYPSKYVNLSFPTADTVEIVRHCRNALEQIYKEGYEYKKAGVILTDIVKQDNVMRDLFDPIDREKQKRLSKVLDDIVKKNGAASIHLAAQGTGGGAWGLRREFLSKCPSTNMSEIIEIKLG